MVQNPKEVIKNDLESKLVMQIHDELIFEFPDKEEEVLVRISC